MAEHPPTGEIYGHLTGRKRVSIMLLGAISGVAVAALFALFARQSPAPADLIIGAIVGAALGYQPAWAKNGGNAPNPIEPSPSTRRWLFHRRVFIQG